MRLAAGTWLLLALFLALAFIGELTGKGRPGSYTYPEPDGMASAILRPAEAFFDSRLDEFALTYDAVRSLADPDAAVLEFFRSTYEAGADLAGWDRALLEPSELPSRPPKQPWSIRR